MMTQQQYERISAPFRTPARIRALRLTNKLLTAGVYAAYCLCCAKLVLQLDPRLVPALLIPGVPFVLLSLVRAKINAPRPYEALNIEPLLKKHRSGNSFPSRHVFSAFVIGMTLCRFWLPLGIIILAAGALLSAIRVIGGVHFPRDVIAGSIVGIVSGGIGILIWNLIGGMA